MLLHSILLSCGLHINVNSVSLKEESIPNNSSIRCFDVFPFKLFTVSFYNDAFSQLLMIGMYSLSQIWHFMSLPIIHCICQVCMINKCENMRSLDFMSTLFVILQLLEKVGCTTIAAQDICLTPTNIEKCDLCTNRNKSDPSYNRNCFHDGVYHKFFQCANSDNSKEFSCDSDIQGRFVQNFVSVMPANGRENKQNNSDWKCYFDITNGEKGDAHRARFLISDSLVCSNSTIFRIQRSKNPSYKDMRYEIQVHSGSMPGTKSHIFTFGALLVTNTKFPNFGHVCSFL